MRIGLRAFVVWAGLILCTWQIEANPGMGAVAGLLSTLNAPDSSASNVTFLMKADGANASTAFTDGSQLGNTITAVGTAQISTTQSRFGGSSAKFDGSTAYLRVPGNAFVLGSADFTIEAWVYPTANPAMENSVVGNETWNSDGFNSGDTGWLLGVNRSTAPSGGVNFSICNAGTCTSNTFGSFLALNSWHHVAVTRSGSIIYFFSDGALLGTVAFSGSQSDNKPYLRVGGIFANGSFYAPGAFNGYIDELRITIGVARYTANYTVPRQPF